MRLELRLLLAGHMLEVDSVPKYYVIYHAFERLQKSNPEFSRHGLVRKELGPSRWLVALVIMPDRVPPKGLSAPGAVKPRKPKLRLL